MIEDALKSTRNLHRLILAVSLVTLVFSLSLNSEETKRAQKAAIDALRQVNFLAYETWLSAKLQLRIDEALGPAIAPIESALEGVDLVLLLDEISKVLREPAHVGRLLTEDLVLSNASAATLSQFEALNDLQLARDVQITVPDLAPLVPKLLDFFETRGTTVWRIENAMVTTEFSESIGTSFVPLDRLTAMLYFELVDSASVAGAPVFQGRFDTTVVEVPDTSFLSWLAEAELGSAVDIVDGRVKFAPLLSGASYSFREEKLGTLSLRLAEEIAAAGPEKHTATILGTQVPGLLVVLAAPLTLMVLTYYFVSHTTHVSRLVERHAKEIRGFAWLPIAISHWRVPGLARPIPGHRIELLASAGLLPLAALSALYVKLRSFGDVSAPASLLLLVASLWIASSWWIAQRKVDLIRELLAAKTH